MKINENGIGVDYSGNAGHCLIIGIDETTQGKMKLDLGDCNSYVITSLDYLLTQTEQVLMFAEELRAKRNLSSVDTVKTEANP